MVECKKRHIQVYDKCSECGATSEMVEDQGCGEWKQGRVNPFKNEGGYLENHPIIMKAKSYWGKDSPATTITNAAISALEKQMGGSHYKDMKIQPVEFIVENEIPYREANVIKYTCRHASKNGKQDIEKAIHYLEMILEDYE